MMMKKIMLAGITGIVLGCTPISNRELVPTMNFGNEREENYQANFFVGREWFDRNKNNSMDKSDGYYNPEVFRENDKILIIGEIEGYDGWLTTRILNNKTGQIVRTAMKEVSGRTLVRYDLTAQDLINSFHGGEGNYRVNWYVGENFDIEKIGEKTFKVKE